MDILEEIKKILTEILDIEDHDITPETYMVRDLGAESIDLLELAVSLNSTFNVEIIDDEIYLRTFRLHMMDAEQRGDDTVRYLSGKFPFLNENRVTEIIGDLKAGPTLKVKDLVSYISWRYREN
jgi:acyl carrier protein